MTFAPENDRFDTSPIFEALVAQDKYVGIWVCSNKRDEVFYKVEFGLVGFMSNEEAAKPNPPRHVEIGSGGFEDGLVRAGNRKPSVFTKTFEEAMSAVMRDIKDANLKSMTTSGA